MYRRLMILTPRLTAALLLIAFIAVAAHGQIYYAGGPVMSGSTNVYVIYYGNWGSLSRTIINTWLSAIGGSSAYAVNVRYRDSTGASVQNILNYNAATNSYNDNYSRGKSLTDSDVQAIITNAISGGSLPADPQNGVYFVLAAADVTIYLTFGTTCQSLFGYHNWSRVIYGFDYYKYSAVQNPLACPKVYDGNIRNGDGTTPNASIGGDGTVNEIFHELSESLTDPFFSRQAAWGTFVLGQDPAEIADQCEWNFGNWSSLPVASNGAHYNVTIGGVNYLLQHLYRIPAVTPYAGEYVYGTCAIGNEPVIALTSSTNPSAVGQAVTYTAIVSASDGGTPTGSVTFTKSNQHGTAYLATLPLTAGQATFDWAFGASGTKFITATYSGDSKYESTVSPAFAQTVK